MQQAMKEEPPLGARCKDRFLIQSTIITHEMERLSPYDSVSPSLSDPLSIARKMVVLFASQNVYVYLMTI